MVKIKDFKLGATGRFPDGKLGPHDEGELRTVIGTDHANGLVRIEFGKPVGWLAIPSSQARELAQQLIERADELDRRKT